MELVDRTAAAAQTDKESVAFTPEQSALLVQRGNQKHTRSPLARTKAKLKDTLQYCARWFLNVHRNREGQVDPSATEDMAQNGCTPFIRGERRCKRWDGSRNSWPYLDMCDLEQSEAILATICMEKLSEMIPTQRYYSGREEHFTEWREMEIPNDWYEEAAKRILEEAKEPSARWGMTKTRRQKLMLPTSEYKRILAESAKGSPKKQARSQ